MSKIVIKKVVKLDFLGDEYKEAEITFRSIPLSEYEKLMDELPKSNPEIVALSEKSKNKEATDEDQARLAQLLQDSGLDNKKSFDMIMNYLRKYFISGKFPNAETGELENLSAEDLDGLDQEASMVCFERLTGQASDPKALNTAQ